MQPHRSESFKLSDDPLFIEMVREVVGLCLNPADNAMVLCVDGKSQVQALGRSRPVLPTGVGYVEGIAHDCVRHGTTTLFAALEIANGQVLTQCKPRHRHQELLSFLRHVDAKEPKDLEVHLIVDNHGIHRHARVRGWLARRPRLHVHYKPSCSSWLNQVERWFGLITQWAIRRGSFSSVSDLRRRIERFVADWSQHAKPFVRTAAAKSILAKLERPGKVICEAQH